MFNVVCSISMHKNFKKLSYCGDSTRQRPLCHLFRVTDVWWSGVVVSALASINENELINVGPG